MVKCILTDNIKTHIDLKIDTIKSCGGLRNEIMAYAISRRIEKARGDDMDIDQAEEYEDEGGEAIQDDVGLVLQHLMGT